MCDYLDGLFFVGAADALGVAMSVWILVVFIAHTDYRNSSSVAQLGPFSDIESCETVRNSGALHNVQVIAQCIQVRIPKEKQ